MKLDCGCENDRPWAMCECGTSFCVHRVDDQEEPYTGPHAIQHIHGCPFRKVGGDGIGYVMCQLVKPGKQAIGGFVP
jgi:hypothetical protein